MCITLFLTETILSIFLFLILSDEIYGSELRCYLSLWFDMYHLDQSNLQSQLVICCQLIHLSLFLGENELSQSKFYQYLGVVLADKKMKFLTIILRSSSRELMIA